VFIPILLSGGIVGDCSASSRTLSVAIMVRWCVADDDADAEREVPQAHDQQTHGWIYRWAVRLDWLTTEYDRGLPLVLQHRAL